MTQQFDETNMNIVFLKCPKCGVKFKHIFRLSSTPNEPHVAKPLTCPCCGNICNIEEVKFETN